MLFLILHSHVASPCDLSNRSYSSRLSGRWFTHFSIFVTKCRREARSEERDTSRQLTIKELAVRDQEIVYRNRHPESSLKDNGIKDGREKRREEDEVRRGFKSPRIRVKFQPASLLWLACLPSRTQHHVSFFSFLPLLQILKPHLINPLRAYLSEYPLPTQTLQTLSLST